MADQTSKSAFLDLGYRASIEQKLDQIKELYVSDQIPWVVGYSGGKDSTAVLQLVWQALSTMTPEERFKHVYVISTDTLVENPAVSAWVRKSLERVDASASSQGLPISAHCLTPEVKNTFWVNLIGKGYPAPRPKFRWCTERMKIKPVDAFIGDVVKQNGEAILVLGTRRAESSVRSAVMKRHAKQRKREWLSPHTSLPNAFVYSPIEDWQNDDVWRFLGSDFNPWGNSNGGLLDLYQSATEDRECPLVHDTSTQSCGSSRFGCWTCTMVDEDKSMKAMVTNDEEKAWMQPLLDFRNELDEHDHDKRDFRRMSGHVQLFTEVGENGETRAIPGPYTQASRADWLRKLLKAQQKVRTAKGAPKEALELELITLPELHAIRKIWVVDKHEVEDLLPTIYLEETGTKFPTQELDESQPFGLTEMELLKEACDGDSLHFELVRELLDIERQYRTMSKRANLFDRIDKAFKKGFYESADDAKERAADRRKRKAKIASDAERMKVDREDSGDELKEVAV